MGASFYLYSPRLKLKLYPTSKLICGYTFSSAKKKGGRAIEKMI